MARHDVTTREFLLHRLGLHHEALHVLVEQVATVAAATFGHEYPGRHNGRRMKLHRFHIAERYDTGIECNRRARTLVDRGIARVLAVDASITAGSDDCCLGHYCKVRAVTKVSDHRTHTTRAVVNERHRFGAIANGNAESYDLAVNSIERGVAGTRGRIAGAPLGRTAEVAVRDQSILLKRFVDLDVLALDEVLVLAAAHACPWHTEMCEFAHGNHGFFSKNICDFLIGSPV